MKVQAISVLALLLLPAMIALAPEAHAHARSYVFSQEYQTLPKGGMEFEGHNYYVVPNIQHTNTNKMTYQGELEYGVTDHLTVAHYESWQTVNTRKDKDDDTRYSGFKWEAKYRIGEKGKYWVDPLLYVEWKTDPRNHANPNAIETKLILSKDFDRFNMTYNQIMDNTLGEDGRTKQEFTWGLSYEVLTGFRTGLEIKGSYWTPGTHKNKLGLGPTLAYEGDYFWVALGVLWGVNHHTDDIEPRLIVGIPF